MVESTSISITPATHADRHQTGGEDPLSSPIMTEPHHTTHESGGSDPITGIEARYSGVIVHNNTTSPIAMTDLDLSAVVGSARALVYLRVTDVTGKWYKFRTNGDTAAVGNNMGSCTYTNTGANAHNTILVMTDAAGIVEWMSNNNANSTVTLLAWIPLV